LFPSPCFNKGRRSVRYSIQFSKSLRPCRALYCGSPNAACQASPLDPPLWTRERHDTEGIAFCQPLEGRKWRAARRLAAPRGEAPGKGTQPLAGTSRKDEGKGFHGRRSGLGAAGGRASRRVPATLEAPQR